jgi:hypothetical protein
MTGSWAFDAQRERADSGMMRLGIDQRQEVLPDVLAAGLLLPRLLLLIPDGDLVEGDDPPETGMTGLIHNSSH